MTLDKVNNLVELAKVYVDKGIKETDAIALACKVIEFNEKILINNY